jgi:serine protease AprX
MAVLDSGFYPHPDLTQPCNRIRAWVDAATDPIAVMRYKPDETPYWPDWDSANDRLWHGTMTAVVAAGNGYLSHGLYRGLAGEADLVLIQVRNRRGIHNPAILRGLRWIAEHQADLNIRVVNMSIGGDPVAQLRHNSVDTAVADLINQGIVVTVSAGNDGLRCLVPPATAPEALTIGGLDDHNTFDHDDVALWHSSYGLGTDNGLKPELVAPSIWVAAPLLPDTPVAREAAGLFQKRGNETAESRIAELKLITPHYQHVDGTSFAAPLVAGTVACLLEANPDLSPLKVRQILQQTAMPVPGVSRERQGAGALTAGAAVSLALHERHASSKTFSALPLVGAGRIIFVLRDHDVQRVQVLGSWDNWQSPGLEMVQVEPGVWQVERSLLPDGRYKYKFLLDGARWLDDPANMRKSWDGFGGFNSLLTIPAGQNKQ